MLGGTTIVRVIIDNKFIYFQVGLKGVSKTRSIQSDRSQASRVLSEIYFVSNGARPVSFLKYVCLCVSDTKNENLIVFSRHICPFLAFTCAYLLSQLLQLQR